MGFVGCLLHWYRLAIVFAISMFWGFWVILRMLWLLVTKTDKFLSSPERMRPSCLDEPKYGSHGYVKLQEGIQLHYVVSGPQDKPAILFLHGFPEFWYSWRHQITHFNRDYRVIAVDLRGYGESSKPSSVGKYKIDTLVEDICSLIHELGFVSVNVIGHDWGGAITWQLCEKYPLLVKKAAILNCPHPAVMPRYLATHWAQFMKSWYMFFINLPYVPELFFWSGDKRALVNAFTGHVMGAKKGAFTEQDIECFKYMFSDPGSFTGPMNYVRAALRYTPINFISMVTGTKNPPIMTKILLIWGTRDGALCTEMAELSRAYAARFQLRLIQGASHWVQQDEPELVNRYLEDFLLTKSDKLSLNSTD